MYLTGFFSMNLNELKSGVGYIKEKVEGVTRRLLADG